MANEKQRTARMRSGLTAAVVTLLLGNAVALGAIEPVTGSGPKGAAPAPSIALPDLPMATAGSAAAGDAGSEAAGGTGGPATSTAPAPGSRSSSAPTTMPSIPVPSIPPSNWTYEVTLTPMCVMTGAPLTVTLQLVPNAAAGIIIAYADGETYGSMHQGYAGPDGTFTRTFPAAPVAGPANLLTSALHGDKRGGTRVEFRVVGVTEPC